MSRDGAPSCDTLMIINNTISPSSQKRNLYSYIPLPDECLWLKPSRPPSPAPTPSRCLSSAIFKAPSSLFSSTISGLSKHHHHPGHLSGFQEVPARPEGRHNLINVIIYILPPLRMSLRKRKANNHFAMAKDETSEWLFLVLLSHKYSLILS